jgi:hypothetical protein
MKETLQALVGREVVVDTRSPWVYIGKLAAVHDSGETSLPKERYWIAACETGIKANRRSVYVNLEYVVSVSPLDDVIKF